MMTLVIGGSGSGKSAYAEELLADYREKYYLATMQICDEESGKKAERHRRLRQGKGFVTIEQPKDLLQASAHFSKENGKPQAALLECMSNLVANEMFAGDGIRESARVADKILRETAQFAERLDELVIVSNNVFEDGILYDETTMEYLRALGAVNTGLAEIADRVIEVVVGIPVQIK